MFVIRTFPTPFAILSPLKFPPHPIPNVRNTNIEAPGKTLSLAPFPLAPRLLARDATGRRPAQLRPPSRQVDRGASVPPTRRGPSGAAFKINQGCAGVKAMLGQVIRDRGDPTVHAAGGNADPTRPPSHPQSPGSASGDFKDNSGTSPCLSSPPSTALPNTQCSYYEHCPLSLDHFTTETPRRPNPQCS